MKITMKRIAFFAGVLLLVASAACAQKSDKRGGNKSAKMETEMDSLSYVFGANLGQNIREAEIEGVNSDMVYRGFVDAVEGEGNMAITTEDGNEMVRVYMTRMQSEKAEKSKGKAKEYMEKESKDDSYQRTESGILYKVLEQGSGATPTAESKVRVNYEGKTTEGKVFDSSYERGQPAEFPLNRVIPGWTEVLQLMQVGTTIEATIPPALAYGERGSPPNIGPNEVLIFKIELIDILEN